MSLVWAILIVFLCISCGAIAGMKLRSTLPDHHLVADSMGVVKLGIGLIATMTALLLSMQNGAARATYDNTDRQIKEIAGKLGYLDRVLSNYGPEATEARRSLRDAVARGIQRTWSGRGTEVDLPNPTENVYHQLQQLSPNSATKAALKTEAIALASEISRVSWLMVAQAESSGPFVFRAIVVVWLTIVFAGFGMLGPRNATVILTLLVCALSVSVALGIIVELNRPFGGVVQVSNEPLRKVLTLMGA